MENLETTVQEAGFFGRMKDRVSDYASAAGQKAKTAAAIATVLTAGILGGQKADGATMNLVDQIPELGPHPRWVENPNPEWGNIIDIDASRDGERVYSLHADGVVSIRNSDYSTLLDFIPLTSGASISSVSPDYGNGADFAIIGSGGRQDFFKEDGTYTGTKDFDLPTGSVRKASWDYHHDQWQVLTATDLYIVDADQNPTHFSGWSRNGIEVVATTDDFFDIQINGSAWGYNLPNGDPEMISPDPIKNYGTNAGAAITKQNVIGNMGTGVAVSDYAPWMDNVEHSIPEPASVLIGLAGLAAIGVGRTGRNNYKPTPKGD